jgi:hypothetical protein
MKKTFFVWRSAQVAFLSLTLVSCENDLLDGNDTSESAVVMKSSSSEHILPDVHTQIVLGDVRENPYSVESIRAAFEYYNNNVPDSPYKEKEVEATHFYIQVNPTTEAHRATLDNLDNTDDLDAPTLHDYPLDKEIIQEGDYYIMPKESNDVYHAAYTVIPRGYTFQNPVPYTVMSELYLPSDDEFDVESIALVFANWQEDLVADFGEEIYKDDLPELLPQWVDASTQKRLFGRKYTPVGRIRVENSDSILGGFHDFENAKISIGRNFFWTYTNTNLSGNFTARKTYRGKVRIRAKFRGEIATVRKSRNELVGLWVSDHVMTITRGSNNPTRVINYFESIFNTESGDTGGGHLWTKATTHIGLSRYNRYAIQNGITRRLDHANVWAWSNGSSSVTPMLKKYPTILQVAAFSNIGQANVWQNLTAIAGTTVLSIAPPQWRPDILFQNLGGKDAGDGVKSNTVRIHQLIFHEAGHYSHASQVGQMMWAENMAATISNSIASLTWSFDTDPYRNGAQPSFQAADRISIVEGWATVTEFKITNFYYKKAYVQADAGFGFIPSTATGTNLSIEHIMENFNMYERPMNEVRLDDRGWFMHGLFWDLLDNRNEILLSASSTNTFSRYRTGNGLSLNNIVDNCNISIGNNTNNLFPVFNALRAQVENPCDLYSILKTQNPNSENALIQLFNSYGFPCGQALP